MAATRADCEAKFDALLSKAKQRIKVTTAFCLLVRSYSNFRT